jgi:hypothetical protein
MFMGSAIERTKKLTATVATITALSAPQALAQEKPFSQQHSNARTIESFNWAGYVVKANKKDLQKNSVTEVKGEWTIPSITCTDKDSTASIWVGIDGEASKTVEQIGNDYNCTNGEPDYPVWYEMYPKAPIFFDLHVQAGDKMHAEVIYVGKNQYSLMIEDKTSGELFSTIQKEPTAKRMSAEWIIESQDKRDLPQTDTIQFDKASVTMNEHTGTIKDPNWDAIDVFLINKKDKLLAKPVNLSSDGSSFEVQWLAPR